MGLWYLVLQCVIIGAVANENSLPINQINSLEATLTMAESRILEQIALLSDKINKFNDRVDAMKRDISSIQLVISETKATVNDGSINISSCVNQTLNTVRMETSKMFNATERQLGKLSEQLQHLAASSERRTSNLEHQLERLPAETGVYFMQPDIRVPLNFSVSRDWTNNHGFGDNWIVFQRRFNGSLNFYRNWTEYRDGFGDLRGEHWLGLEKLHAIVQMRQHELLIVLEDFDGVVAYAHYGDFKIGNESEKYVLKSVGRYKGTAGDSFSSHKDERFSTYDQDNDKHTANCAQWASGAWWFYTCHRSHLNGKYFAGKNDGLPAGIMWYHFRGTKALKSSRMMVRPAE